MRWSVGSKLAAGFGLAVAIFLIVGIVADRTTAGLVEAGHLRQNAYKILMQVAELASLLRDMELGQRDYLLTGESEHAESYRAIAAPIRQAVEELRRLTKGNERQQRRLEQLEPLIRSRLALADETSDLRRTQGLEAAAQFVSQGRGIALTDEITELLLQLRNEEEELLESRIRTAEASARNATLTIRVGILVAVVAAALAALLITRDIAAPLRQLTGLASRVVVGDLSSEALPSNRSDEVGVLAVAFDRMTQFLRSVSRAAERIAAGDLRGEITPQSDQDVLGHAFVRMSSDLREQLGGLSQGTAVLGSSSSEIVASTVQLAASATESATAVSQTTTTVAEVRQTAQLANEKAKLVSENALRAQQSSLHGRSAIESLIVASNRIREQMQAIAASMVRLSEQGHTIGQIIATVEDLAAQSNLLAVNAAIEAAKAGEQGKGFGVVAQEIKALAEQSRQATDQVRTILGEIQKATSAAVMATEQGTKSVEQGAAQTEGANQAIQALMTSVTEASQAATQIAASSQEQLIGMEQIAAAMESIKGASTQNVASAKQLESAARNLDELGRRLKAMVDRYVV